MDQALDLLEANSIKIVQQAHKELVELFSTSGAALPENAGKAPDRVVRKLDCAVINFVHAMRTERKRQPFDSVRAAFLEGNPLYDGAGFHARTHIQLCIRAESQIIGYFRVPKEASDTQRSPKTRKSRKA